MVDPEEKTFNKLRRPPVTELLNQYKGAILKANRIFGKPTNDAYDPMFVKYVTSKGWTLDELHESVDAYLNGIMNVKQVI